MAVTPIGRYPINRETLMERCLILDCDGVLVDSEVIANRVAARCFTEAGAPIAAEEMVRRFAGMKATKVTELVFAKHRMEAPPGATEARREAIMAALEAELEAIPGVSDALEAIPLDKCVASSSHPDRIALALKVTGLDHFFGSAVYSSFMVERGKPAPDLFLFAASQMGAMPANCLVVEDSVAGVEAGIAAGMDVIGFIGGSHCLEGHGDRLKAAGARRVIGHMRELPGLVA